MSKDNYHYPDHLTPCQFCGENDVQMNAALVRLPDGVMQGAFDLECMKCGFKTKAYQYPDITVHAWNMSAKLAVHDMTDAVSTAKKSDE